jgi:hypothetical protein
LAGSPERGPAQHSVGRGESLESVLKTPQKKLLAEIVEASTYLQNLHSRLEADAQTGSGSRSINPILPLEITLQLIKRQCGAWLARRNLALLKDSEAPVLSKKSVS